VEGTKKISATQLARHLPYFQITASVLQNTKQEGESNEQKCGDYSFKLEHGYVPWIH